MKECWKMWEALILKLYILRQPLKVSRIFHITQLYTQTDLKIVYSIRVS